MSDERRCGIVWVPNIWGFADAHCSICGALIYEVANGLDEQIPERCPECGAKVSESDGE